MSLCCHAPLLGMGDVSIPNNWFSTKIDTL